MVDPCEEHGEEHMILADAKTYRWCSVCFFERDMPRILGEHLDD